MLIYLDDHHCKQGLKPFSSTRHVSDIRVGILTIEEKWAQLLQLDSVGQLSFSDSISEEVIKVPANVIPTKNNYKSILALAKNGNVIEESDEIKILNYPWDIFQKNEWALNHDFEILTHGRTSQPIHASNAIQNEKNIFIEKGAIVNHCMLNANNGPIYIGKNAHIMEGVFIRGPFSLGEESVIKMGATIYGATSIGPFCVAGGEIKNSIMMQYSNKAHYGYLGDSVLGAWCNLGAGTTNSNLKNSAGEVSYKIDQSSSSIKVGNKAGLIMGDYSRAAINTSFNTGTIVGVSCNIFERGFPPVNIPDFTWGNEKYDFSKALRDIENWMKLKNKTLSMDQIDKLKNLYQTEN